MSALTFESSRFGTLEIESEAVIEFPSGLIGLGGARYALLSTNDDSPFAWLQSVDDPQLALPVTNPWLFFGDYEVELEEPDAAADRHRRSFRGRGLGDRPRRG